jgi:ring-1,2-phenylacetyl-CoA epoxidase subunit PaaC
LYETADAIRIQDLLASKRPEVAGLAQKIEREEAYHLIHAEMWVARLAESEEGREHLSAGLAELWPYALGLVEGDQRERFRAAVSTGLGDLAPEEAAPVERGGHDDSWPELWDEMTSVRRSVPGAVW